LLHNTFALPALRAPMFGGSASTPVFAHVPWKRSIALYHQSVALVVAANVVGLAISPVQSATYIVVVDATAAERTSEAIGWPTCFSTHLHCHRGQVIFLLLATSTVKDPAQGAGTFPSEASYLLAFAFVIAMALIGLLVAWLPWKGASVGTKTPIAVPAALAAETRHWTESTELAWSLYATSKHIYHLTI
jgi:hypothetical protein